jgi:hypothetical protein
LYLLTDTTDADATISPSSTFSSTGITINGLSSYASNSSYNYVLWAWNANSGSTTNITVGQYSTSPNVPSIASTVSANTTAGFSIVAYTGNGTNGATVGHGLGAKPFLIIEKGRTSTYNWSVQGCGELWTPVTSNLFLNNTNGLNASGAVAAPTSTVFTPSVVAYANESGVTNIAYCFAPIAGYSAFGKYTGNGVSDGPFIYTGFRPRFVMVKCSSSDQGGNAVWGMFDTSRNAYNVANNRLIADLSNSESTSPWLDINSNGFKIRETSTSINGSGATYIYMAFAELPLKFSNAR